MWFQIRARIFGLVIFKVVFTMLPFAAKVTIFQYKFVHIGI